MNGCIDIDSEIAVIKENLNTLKEYNNSIQPNVNDNNNLIKSKISNNNMVEENFDSYNDNQNSNDIYPKFNSTFRNLTINNNNSFIISDKIEDIINRGLKLKTRVIQVHQGDVWTKIAVWNLQSLNLKISQRYVKIEFLRDLFNENKFDLIFLIDVNDVDVLILNRYTKYTDERSILFVKDDIESSFIISRNLIFSEEMKLAFAYLTPSNNDNILIDNITNLIKANFTIVGDFNIKSNKNFSKNVYHFMDEDSLQTGFISKKLIKLTSIAAPSDHRLLIANMKSFCRFNFSLRIKSLDFKSAKENIFKIFNGQLPDCVPTISVKQTYLQLNDRESTINSIMNDYLKNNVAKIYKKFNYLWKFSRREPFLGKKVSFLVESSYANHLQSMENKKYLECKSLHLSKMFYNTLSVKLTKSKAVNDNFIGLCDISNAVRDFLIDEKFNREIAINNVFKVANDLRESLNAETFFLQKNRIIKDFNDVRVIIIIPTIIKMYESLIYNKVANYVSNLFNNSPVRYQFGAITGGSTFDAILNLRFKLNKIWK